MKTEHPFVSSHCQGSFIYFKVLTFGVKEIWKVPARGDLSVSYLCRDVRGVVVISSNHVPRGSFQGNARVHALKGRSKSWIIHRTNTFVIKIVSQSNDEFDLLEISVLGMNKKFN